MVESHRTWVDELLVRHEVLLLRMEVKDRPSPCCRSSRVKLEGQPEPRLSVGEGRGAERPRQSLAVRSSCTAGCGLIGGAR